MSSVHYVIIDVFIRFNLKILIHVSLQIYEEQISVYMCTVRCNYQHETVSSGNI
jgi:hypothetical protein